MCGKTQGNRPFLSLPIAAAVFLAVGAGCKIGEGFEDLRKIIIVAEAHFLRHGRYRCITSDKQLFCGVDAPLGNDVGQGASPGELFRQ